MTRRSPYLLLVAGALFVLLLARPAAAQPMGKTLVVPFAADGALPLATAKQLEGELAKRHVPLVSLHEAHDQFLARSRTSQSPSRSDLDALASEAQAAIEHVAFGRTASAQRAVQRIIELADRSLETLNRETSTARSLLDACLALVRASLHEQHRDEALEQAMRCRRLVPDLAPSDVAHPANVVGALAEADDQLRRMRVGRLIVEAAPERHCEVYLNGRHLGHTPFSLDRAPVGDYRVQVECKQQAGRVHVVQLGDEPVKLLVDEAFDANVITEPRLALRHAPTAPRSDLVKHASLLGRELNSDDVVLVGQLDGALTILRVQVKQGGLVSGAAGKDLALARVVETLAEGRFLALDPATYRAQPETAPAPVPRPAPSPRESAGSVPSPSSTPDSLHAGVEPAHQADASTRQRRRLLIAGGVLAGLGAAGLGTGFGLYAHARKLRQRAEQGEPGSPEQTARQSRYDDFRLVPLAGVAGAALLTAAVPLLMPPRAPRGAAAWAGGALGIAAIAVGAALSPGEPVLGGLLMSSGAPLITIPITQLVRASR